MNISQLEYYVATMRCGSFSMAARELFVSPQAVSRGVNELERELDVALCVKTSHCIKPTPFGRVFSARASEILSCMLELEALAKAQSVAQAEEGAASLAVACSPCRGNIVHPEDLSLFKKAYPHVNLTITYHPSGTCLAALEEGVVDAAIIVGRTTKPGIDCVRLLSFPLGVLVSRDHPLASQRCVAIDDLQGFPLAAPEDLRYCHAIITDHLKAKGLDADYTALPPYIEDHRAFLNEGRGAFFVADDPLLETMYPDAILLPIVAEDLMTIPLCLAFEEDTENDAVPLVEHFLVGMATGIRRWRL
ncbi:LysR family transcriptional regulator [Arabiibacter massiliensis]|uniref:LysR family transcriptional regulator n=1 Tax=Arabiibacter massiliensis TaxID=1870985 RepID=UPI0009BA9E49|nr:LysR family transcriptional regulator [Arabiibacter massiliensis]